MNTNNLKRFAQSARRKLLEQVSAKLEFVLTHETTKLKDRAETIKRLNEELKSIGREALVDRVAYTWFNRLVALRFMDANGFQPIGIHVITPVSGISPQILDEAHAGHISDELPVRKEEVMNILDGKAPSVNPDNDAYRILLVASCNQLSTVFPFLFERINDFTELLLPDDLTSPFSIIKDILNGMTDEDCQEVEIIGWLYQFYISEKKDEVFASGEKVKKEDIPAATQLFTPRWIVEYMVQNTLGKLWLQNRPNSKLRDLMPYYIESPTSKSEDFLKVNSVEEITLLDQACGSGHILVYGFELFSKIYEEEGYASSEIPQLIIEKNLFGFEIDERAAQLAGFALMMKARSYHRRFFRKEVKPNILCFQDLKLSEEEVKPLFKDLGTSLSDALYHDLKTMKQATNFGSLIQPHTDFQTLEKSRTIIQSKLQNADIFLQPKIENLIQTVDQLILLSKKYSCVVDNPPYMGGGNMNKELAEFVKTNYPNSKSDLMTCFMEAGIKGLLPKGYLGMINLPSWLFLSSFEGLRELLIKNYQIESLLHMGRGIFGVDWGSTAFIVHKNDPSHEGKYFKLHKRNFQHIYPDDIKSIFLLAKSNDETKINFDKYREGDGISSVNELVANEGLQIAYTTNQKDFEKIPGSPIGYWLSDKILETYEKSNSLSELSETKIGQNTGDNNRFLRHWFEVKKDKFDNNLTSNSKLNSTKKWVPYRKGGSFRKWAGNEEYCLNWENNGIEVKEYSNFRNKGKGYSRYIVSLNYCLKEGITWSFISSGKFNVRWAREGFIFDVAGSSCFPKDNSNLNYILGFLNSSVAEKFISIVNPTLNFQGSDVKNLPLKLIPLYQMNISSLVEELKTNSKLDWDSSEVSWDFKKNKLIENTVFEIDEAYDLYRQAWSKKFLKVHKNEEELNYQFIEIYGLQGELFPQTSLEEITILQDELDRDALKIQNSRLKRDTESGLVSDYSSIELKFNEQEIFTQFVSYSVGCMFGRYSLDKEGLIFANQGETIEDYFKKIEKSESEVSFLPDEDNIIPILDDEWFEDDIVSRFHEFLKASFGEKYFRKNLAFVEECLGKDIRKYFVKDFYKDHIQRYKKRPIYWSFSSPKGYFNVLIYMHRYTPDTLNRILNNYLREFIEKLQAHRKNLLHIEVTGTPAEQNKARKEINKLDEMIADCRQYETDILYPLATERISIDLDEGVFVNYNKFGKAISEVAGLNDKRPSKR